MGSERVAVVVGASSGVGRATAHLLAEQGWHLLLASRGAEPLAAAAEECRAKGASSASTHLVDVRDAQAVHDLLARAVSLHGHVHAVVNTAAVVAFGRFEEIPVEVFDALIATNVLGSANVARAALPVLRRQEQGTLVLLGSVLGQAAAPAMTPYVVSKWAVRSLGRQLQLENRDVPGVRVCVVSPGSVDTPIYQQAANYQGQLPRPPFPVLPVEAVAGAVVGALERPRHEISVSVGPANGLLRAGFTLFPFAYNTLVGPLVRLLATTSRRVPPSSGNVLEPQEELEAVHGEETRHLVPTAGGG